MSLSLVILGIVATGCAGIQAAIQEGKERNRLIGEYKFQVPCDQAYPDAQTLLFSAGYEMATEAGASLSQETKWKAVDKSTVRYRLIGAPADEKSCQIRFMRQFKGGGNIKSEGLSEDADMKMKLIEQLAPEDAGKIRVEAKTLAQQSVS